MKTRMIFMAIGAALLIAAPVSGQEATPSAAQKETLPAGQEVNIAAGKPVAPPSRYDAAVAEAQAVDKTDMAAGARVDDLKGLSCTGRYLRVYCSARTSKFGYSLFELEVYGSQAPVSTSEGKSGFYLTFGYGMPIPL